MTPRPSARTITCALAVACACVCAIAAGALHAEPNAQVPVGPRAIAMGGAFSSIADDASALFWNPAGLPWIGHQEISASYANQFQTDVRDNDVAFVLPMSPRRAAGVEWYHSGFADPELDFGENRFVLSYGMHVASQASIGASLKYVNRTTALDGAQIQSGGGFGADLGAMVTPLRGLRAAVVLQDVFDTRVDALGGGSAVAYPRALRVGASYAPRNLGVVALEFDDRVHVGLETRPHELVALRAGMERDLQGHESPTWSAGAGLAVGIVRFDYAYVMPPNLDATSHFGMSLAFNFNPAQLRIEHVEGGDLYASLYKSYAERPLGSVEITNLQDSPIEATVSVFIPEVMDAPSEERITLRPQVTERYPLRPVLSDRAMRLAGDRRLPVEVRATYQSLRLSRTETARGQTQAYARGAIHWESGMDQAAAFVTTRDPVVESFAREVARWLAQRDPSPGLGKNVVTTAALFDALETMGVSYVSDPQSGYSARRAHPRAVDTIYYPRETLARRVGDCDDMSVLMAALLGNLGINSQLVDAPGHVFLLVDTGVHEKNRIGLALPESLTVAYDQEVWIPLETTAIPRGFAAAWREGAELFARLPSPRDAPELLTDVTEARDRFEPADLPGAGDPIARVEPALLAERVERDLGTLGDWRKAYVASRYDALAQGLDASAASDEETARIHFLAGRIADARAILERAAGKDSSSSRWHNNLGNVRLVEGETAPAIALYTRALALDPADAGIRLNLGIAHTLAGDSLAADRAFDEALVRAGGFASAARILGLSESAESMAGREGAGPPISGKELRALLVRAARRVPSVPAGGSSASGRQNPKVTSQIAATRGDAGAELTAHLYWKD